MNDGVLGRSAVALGLAVLLHAIPLSFVHLPELPSPPSARTLSIEIRYRPGSGGSVPSGTDSGLSRPPERSTGAAASPEPLPPRGEAPPPVEASPEPLPPVDAPPAVEPHPPTESPSAGEVSGVGTDEEAPAMPGVSPTPLVEAVPRRTPPPTYPESARREGRSGVVEIELFLDTRGRVETAAIVGSSGHADLDEAALAAVRRWRFEGGAAGRRTRRRFEFRLENAYTP